MRNRKISRITILSYFKRQAQKNLSVLIKLHEIILYIGVMLFLVMYMIGIFSHVVLMLYIGILGSLIYVLLWCYVSDMLYKIKNKR